MALINCPECGKEISDRSPTCIHCGYPLTTERCIENADSIEQHIENSEQSSDVQPSKVADLNMTEFKLSGVGGWLALLVDSFQNNIAIPQPVVV